MQNGIELSFVDGIAYLTLNRPNQRNALDLQATKQLADAIDNINNNGKVLAVVLSGAAGMFCAGADLAEISKDGAIYRPWAGSDGPLAKPCSKPVVAAIEGYAVAGGLGLALWADLRVASESAIFGVFCRRFGVPMSDGTPTRLPTVVGRSRALDMLLTGRPVDAEEAMAIGLVNRLVPKGEAFVKANKLAKEIAGFPASAMRADRLAAWSAFDKDEVGSLIFEAQRAEGAKINEAVLGAQRFASGVGKHGEFSE
mgnify:CR=1 FL=1